MTMPLHTQAFAGIPIDVPGRLTVNDFIYFAWDSDELEFQPLDYDVVIESDSGEFISITSPPIGEGHITRAVQLPQLAYTNGTLIGVIPKLKNGPRYFATLQRGKTYNLNLFSKALADNVFLMHT
jgi:hypothetical protein